MVSESFVEETIRESVNEWRIHFSIYIRVSPSAVLVFYTFTKVTAPHSWLLSFVSH